MDIPNQVELQRRLDPAERALKKSERLAVASRYASAIMHEVNNPLEAMINLVYLTKTQRNYPDQVYENMVTIEQQLAMLNRVAYQAPMTGLGLFKKRAKTAILPRHAS